MLQKALSILLGYTLFLATAACSYPGVSTEFGPKDEVLTRREAKKEYKSVEYIDPPNVEFEPKPLTPNEIAFCRKALSEANRWYTYFRMEGLRVELTCGVPDMFQKGEHTKYFYHGATEIHSVGPRILIWINPLTTKPVGSVVVHEFVHILISLVEMADSAEFEEYVVRLVAPLLYSHREGAEVE